MHTILRIAAAAQRLQTPDETPRDITGPELVPDVGVAGISPALWIALAVLAMVIVAAVVVWIASRRRTSRWHAETAAARSLRQLERLEQYQLLSKGRAERHYTLLAGILRRFIARRYGIAAPHRTTDEFLGSIASHVELARDFDFLKHFLNGCDLAKFAPPAAVNGDGSRLSAELREWLLRQKASNSP